MNKGFTVIELLVAVMIVSILTAVAVSSYSDYVTRANRADAKTVLLEVTGMMERNYTATGCYHRLDNDCTNATATVSLAGWGLDHAPKEGTARYNVSFSAISAQAYTVQAVPVSADAECGTFTLSHTGVKTESGSSDVATCWNQ